MDRRAKGAGRLSVSPTASGQYFGGRGTTQTQVGPAPVGISFGGGVNPQGKPAGSVQVGTGFNTSRGEVNYNASMGIQASGSRGENGVVGGRIGPYAGVGASTNQGDQTYSAGAGYSAGGPYAGVGATTTQGDITYGLGVGYGAGGVGVTPTIQVGQGESNRRGAEYGGAAGAAAGTFFGPAGTIAGSFLGSAAGSLIGGQTSGGRNRKEHDVRNNIIRSLDDAGLWDRETRIVTNPDGSTFDFSQTGRGGEHGWTNINRRSQDHSNRDQLFSYDTDYTNDLDYVSYMAGSSLARILGGQVNKGIDQFGGQLGNSFLGKSGYGAQMTQENFNNVMNNARAQYAKVGIGTKEDMLGLANKLFAEGKIKDVDYAVMQQTAGMLFDNDYNTAVKLMSGRDKGIAEAAKTPAGGGGRAKAGGASPEQAGQAAGQYVNKGRVWRRTPGNPVISAEEAWAQTKPFFDMFRAEHPVPNNAGSNRQAVNNSIMSAASLTGLYSAANKLTRGLTDKGIIDWLREWMSGSTNTVETNPDTGKPYTNEDLMNMDREAAAEWNTPEPMYSSEDLQTYDQVANSDWSEQPPSGEDLMTYDQIETGYPENY